MRIRRVTAFILTLALALSPLFSARAYQATTLRSGMRGEAVKELQTALIRLGYLGGTADGIFGTHTENAVRKFQRANNLTSDGLAGLKTLDVLFRKASMTPAVSTASSSSAGMASAASSSASSPSGASTTSSSSSSSSSLFGGNYATLRMGSTGTRVKVLQTQLISLGFLKGSADGKFGALTRSAVVAYQKANRLTSDGLAGKQTLTSIEKKASASSSSSSASSPSPSSASSSSSSPSSSSGGTASSFATASGPSGSKVRLLHWFDDIKPTLKNGQTLLIHEPSSGLSWNLRVYSCGRHCDAEPLTAEDTAAMLKAFGGQNTWSQKAVYVKLPGGSWTVGSTHDMPHLSGSISSNNFNGHLCVHFLRTMSEARQNDPSYGVSNQNTIRAFWKSLTGETIAD